MYNRNHVPSSTLKESYVAAPVTWKLFYISYLVINYVRFNTILTHEDVCFFFQQLFPYYGSVMLPRVKKITRTYEILSRTYEIIFFHTWRHYASVPYRGIGS